MAIAPVNKFLSIAVPVAPGEQKLYEVPTGTTAILLYAQVSNVGIGQTYPTATLIHRRESRSTGNKRDIRIIKDIEIPPNDAAILIDGRLVLEKTPLTLDRLFLTGVQSGVGTITNVVYHEPTGVATVTTMNPHNFNVGDPITMSGIAFTCSGSTGITTTIFPDPQQSYVVDEITNTVGTSRTFSAVIGRSKGYPHFYNPSIHYFVRSRSNAVTTNTGTQFTPSFATYTGVSGELVLTLGAGHGLRSATTTHTATNALYSPVTGIMTVTVANHGFSATDKIKFADGSITFTCAQDSHASNHPYPRSTDYPSGKWLGISNVTTNTFEAVVLDTIPSTYTGIHTFVSATTNGISRAYSTVGIATDSIIFTCTQDGNSTEHGYPRSTDPYAGLNISIASTTTTTATVNVGTSPSGGLVAPLQMEFIASILENSTA